MSIDFAADITVSMTMGISMNFRTNVHINTNQDVPDELAGFCRCRFFVTVFALLLE